MSKSDPGHKICFGCHFNLDKASTIWDTILQEEGLQLPAQYRTVRCQLGYKQNPKTQQALTNALKNNAEVCERLKREL